MDSGKFDDFTRRFAGRASRRGVLKALGGGLVGAAASALGGGAARAASCTSAADCLSGQVCCTGSCVSGVCCSDSDCAQPSNQCQTVTCQQGGCVIGTRVICTPLDACHTAGTCDPSTGTCSNPTAPDGTLCPASGGGSGTCQAGVCVAQTPTTTTTAAPCACAGPNGCSGHGICNPDCSCTCIGDYTGPDCSNVPTLSCTDSTTCADCLAHVSDHCVFCAVTSGLGGGLCVTTDNCIVPDTTCTCASVCPNGCCNASGCQPGTTDTTCGSGGVGCQDCTARSEVCRGGTCVAPTTTTTTTPGPTCDCANLNFCSQHGTCTASCTCSCTPPWMGPACDQLPPVDCSSFTDCPTCQAQASAGCVFCDQTLAGASGVCTTAADCLIPQVSCTCDTTTCSGCCNGNICDLGTTAAVCGTGGTTCVACPVCQTCVGGTCGADATQNGMVCSTSGAAGTCSSGVCMAPTTTTTTTPAPNLCAGVSCPPLDQCHLAGSCDPSTGQCSTPPAPNGTACSGTNACAQTSTCQAGVCVGSNPIVCQASDQCHVAGTCDPTTGACTNPAAADGTACIPSGGGNGTCQGGTCVCTPATSCPSGQQCGTAADGCGGTITCGSCDASQCLTCGAQGTCVATCTSGQGCCGGSCASLTTTSNCGSCGTQCPTTVANASPTCTGGTCGFVCNAGFTLCGGACVNASTDPTNCGACGSVCKKGQSCVNGSCHGGAACRASGSTCKNNGQCCSGVCSKRTRRCA